MAIEVNLDVMMAKRKVSLNELSDRVGLTLANLSILKTGKAKAIRFSTLESICKALDCQPGDILVFVSSLCEPSQLGILFERPQVQSVIPLPHKICFVYFSILANLVSGCFAAEKNIR